MRQQLLTMLAMQDSMNTRVHPQWVQQGYEWYRAVWIECGELMDHYGYKWWKKQTPDDEQVKLEVIDIWHFGMSALFEPGGDAGSDSYPALADGILEAIENFQYSGVDVRTATEQLALSTLETRQFSVADFWQLMTAAGLDFQALYAAYVGKNVLNFFRQDHGYKEGTYIKQWQGREDNEHLADIAAELDTGSESYRDDLYNALSDRYQALTA